MEELSWLERLERALWAGIGGDFCVTVTVRCLLGVKCVLSEKVQPKPSSSEGLGLFRKLEGTSIGSKAESLECLTNKVVLPPCAQGGVLGDLRQRRVVWAEWPSVSVMGLLSLWREDL